jgi:hypothetical protein
MSTELPPALLEFIRTCIPTYQVAEVLLALAAHRDRDFTPDEVVALMRPVVITAAAARKYLGVLTTCGLLRQDAGRFSYDPVPEREPGMQALARAYNEQPVTLVRAIYSNEDRGIQSFADAFKLRKD